MLAKKVVPDISYAFPSLLHLVHKGKVSFTPKSCPWHFIWVYVFALLCVKRQSLILAKKLSLIFHLVACSLFCVNHRVSSFPWVFQNFLMVFVIFVRVSFWKFLLVVCRLPTCCLMFHIFTQFEQAQSNMYFSEYVSFGKSISSSWQGVSPWLPLHAVPHPRVDSQGTPQKGLAP